MIETKKVMAVGDVTAYTMSVSVATDVDSLEQAIGSRQDKTRIKLKKPGAIAIGSKHNYLQ